MIHEDIQKAATDCARRWYHEEWEPENYIQQMLVEDIAAAILAERERCAVLMEKHGPAGDPTYYSDIIRHSKS